MGRRRTQISRGSVRAARAAEILGAAAQLAGLLRRVLPAGVGNYLRADALWMAKISPFRKVKDVSDGELKLLYTSIRGLIWGDYDYKNGVKKGYISKTLKLPNDYHRDFFIYRQDKDINDNIVKKEELYEGSQKRFIYWVENIQK